MSSSASSLADFPFTCGFCAGVCAGFCAGLVAWPLARLRRSCSKSMTLALMSEWDGLAFDVENSRDIWLRMESRHIWNRLSCRIFHAKAPSSGGNGIRLRAISIRLARVRTSIASAAYWLVGEPRKSRYMSAISKMASCASTPPQAIADRSKLVACPDHLHIPPKPVTSMLWLRNPNCRTIHAWPSSCAMTSRTKPNQKAGAK